MNVPSQFSSSSIAIKGHHIDTNKRSGKADRKNGGFNQHDVNLIETPHKLKQQHGMVERTCKCRFDSIQDDEMKKAKVQKGGSFKHQTTEKPSE